MPATTPATTQTTAVWAIFHRSTPQALAQTGKQPATADVTSDVLAALEMYPDIFALQYWSPWPITLSSSEIPEQTESDDGFLTGMLFLVDMVTPIGQKAIDRPPPSRRQTLEEFKREHGCACVIELAYRHLFPFREPQDSLIVP